MAVFFLRRFLIFEKKFHNMGKSSKIQKEFWAAASIGAFAEYKATQNKRTFRHARTHLLGEKKKIKKSSRFSPLCEEKKIKRQTVQPPEKKRGRAKKRHNPPQKRATEIFPRKKKPKTKAVA